MIKARTKSSEYIFCMHIFLFMNYLQIDLLAYTSERLNSEAQSTGCGRREFDTLVLGGASSTLWIIMYPKRPTTNYILIIHFKFNLRLYFCTKTSGILKNHAILLLKCEFLIGKSTKVDNIQICS